MMMVQETVLKNNEMQEKWKTIVVLTCAEYRIKQIEESWESMRKAMKAFSDALEHLFVPVKELLEVFNNKDYKSYPHSYPQYVNKLEINTKGFPQRKLNIRSARSRC